MGDILQFPWHLDDGPACLDIPQPPSAPAPLVIEPISNQRLMALVAEMGSGDALVTFFSLSAAEARTLIAEVASRRGIVSHG